MFKVYLDNRFITISSQPDRLQKYCLFHKYHDIDELYNKIAYFLNNSDVHKLNLYSYKIDSLWRDFKSYFKIHIAAGGLIMNDRNEFLFIMRRGKWDIPKGHLSNDESIPTAARREIEEETGFLPGKELAVLKNSYHIYKLKENWILKETHWFVYRFSNKGKAKPQTEEDITDLRWFGRDQITEVYENTWPSISDVLNEALLKQDEY